MNKLRVYNLYTNSFNEWGIPSKEEALDNSKNTWGKRYDKIEREKVEGGLPILCYRL